MLRNSDDKTYRAYHQGEVDAAHLYGSLARAERDPAVRGVFERLAETEARHARFWAARLAAAGHAEPVAVTSQSARFPAWIARCFGHGARADERRCGTECVTTFSDRWATSQ